MSAGLISKRLYSTRDYNGKFAGNKSITLDGSGDYLSIANNAAFKFGAPSGTANDFTVEFFAYHTDNTKIVYPLGTNYAAGAYWMFSFNRNTNGGATSAGKVGFFLTDGFLLESAAGAITVNTWNHIAVSRAGTTVGLYVNGTRVASGTSSIDPNPTNALLIGTQTGTLSGDFVGDISNVRIVKSAVYTGASLTVPTSLLTAIENTTLLIGQAPDPLIDVSANALTATLNGNATAGTRSPF